jgi:hypothetical protein
MTMGEPVATRVRFEVLEAQRLRLGDQQPEHAPTRGTLTDDVLLGFSEPDGDKLFEPGASLVEDSEGGVTGTDEDPGLFDQVSEQISQLHVCGEHEDCSHEAPELLGIVHPRIGHAGSVLLIPQRFPRNAGSTGRMTA